MYSLSSLLVNGDVLEYTESKCIDNNDNNGRRELVMFPSRENKAQQRNKIIFSR